MRCSKASRRCYANGHADPSPRPMLSWSWVHCVHDPGHRLGPALAPSHKANMTLITRGFTGHPHEAHNSRLPAVALRADCVEPPRLDDRVRLRMASNRGPTRVVSRPERQRRGRALLRPAFLIGRATVIRKKLLRTSSTLPSRVLIITRHRW